MPVLDALPHLTIIRGLKGILDFYYWKGIPCVRKWPVIPPSSRSPRSLESARIFGAIVAAYSLLGAILKQLFAQNAADQPRTARDLFVSAVLGHLHDHNMSDFLDLLTEATAYLAILKDVANALNDVGTDELRVKPGYDGADYFPLLIDAQRHLQADILASALPTDAATAAHQVTQNTALALIEKLEKALETVHTDRLLVRGMDQLFSIAGVLADTNRRRLTAADMWARSSIIPAGRYSVPTNIVAINETTATTAIHLVLYHDASEYNFYSAIKPIAANQRSSWGGQLAMDPSDYIRAYWTGAQVGDFVTVEVTGFWMTLET